MLDLDTRAAILRLRQEGHGTRTIAEAVGVSRDAVKAVLASGEAEVPSPKRAVQLSAHLDVIRALDRECKGNRLRVHEELAARHDVTVAYSTLTRFYRNHGIGEPTIQAVGRLEFAPGQEMQHDTSPHRVMVGGRTVGLHCASLVMCFSHRKFFQCYPRWNRFMVRVFLTRALAYFEGAAASCMLDNSTSIIAFGTGKNAVPAPEMAAFSDHFGFKFVAHAVGDAKRSGRVERPFHHIEGNFYPGRTFQDLADLNAQAVTWCDRDNAKFHRSYQGIPDELHEIERPALARLPLFVPEPTEVHRRRVDEEGYTSLHTNQYSAPEALIGADIDVHETDTHVRLFHGHKLVAQHDKAPFGSRERVTATAHTRRWARPRVVAPSSEEAALRAVGPAVAVLCDGLRKKHGGQALRAMRRLHRFWLDYPDDAFRSAVTRAAEFHVVDLARLEAMILRAVRGDFFKLPTCESEDGNG